MDSVTKRKIDLIYNTTLTCPWDCAVCCVDAVHVKKQGDTIEIRSDGLTSFESIRHNSTARASFSRAEQRWLGSSEHL